MIATLSGLITEKSNRVVVEVGGVGYEVSVSRGDLETLETGKEARLYIYEVIREDAYDLYGFAEGLGKELFEQLLSVSGVGPKAALSILSLSSLDKVQAAISVGDAAFLESAAGVGRRTAERVAVELKNKVISTGYTVASGGASDAALEALEALGYSRSSAIQALSKVSKDLDDEARIKHALKEIR